MVIQLAELYAPQRTHSGVCCWPNTSTAARVTPADEIEPVQLGDAEYAQGTAGWCTARRFACAAGARTAMTMRVSANFFMGTGVNTPEERSLPRHSKRGV